MLIRRWINSDSSCDIIVPVVWIIASHTYEWHEFDFQPGKKQKLVGLMSVGLIVDVKIFASVQNRWMRRIFKPPSYVTLYGITLFKTISINAGIFIETIETKLC